MEGRCFDKGLAFIVEGSTEKVFYIEYLLHLCEEKSLQLGKVKESQEDMYAIYSKETAHTLVMFNSVGSITQMANSATWFQRACHNKYPHVPWTVFLCYDTDEYNSEITKFYEGDWLMLRNSISSQAERIIDLAAKADIEDILLCDLAGVLTFLGLPEKTPIPDGNKGKTKLKKLFRKAATNNAYHSGERARNLIRSLDMDIIRAIAPVPLKEIDRALGFVDVTF